jgi:hypothetical protein
MSRLNRLATHKNNGIIPNDISFRVKLCNDFSQNVEQVEQAKSHSIDGHCPIAISAFN